MSQGATTRKSFQMNAPLCCFHFGVILPSIASVFLDVLSKRTPEQEYFLSVHLPLLAYELRATVLTQECMHDSFINLFLPSRRGINVHFSQISTLPYWDEVGKSPKSSLKSRTSS